MAITIHTNSLMLKEIRLISIGEAAQTTKVRKRDLVRYGIDSSIDLYIRVPGNVVPKLRSKDGRPDLFVNEIELRAIPKYLRIKPEDCATLCEEGEIARHVFPVAICALGGLNNSPEYFLERGTLDSLRSSLITPHIKGDITRESNELEEMQSKEKNEEIHFLRQIPHRTVKYDTELNDPIKFWRTYHLGPIDYDKIIDVELNVKDLLISQNDIDSILRPKQFSCLPNELRPAFARDNFRKNTPTSGINLSPEQRRAQTSNSHKRRHAENRNKIKRIALKVATDNREECQSYADWAACILDLADNNDLMEVNSRVSQRSLEKNLKKWFSLKKGKPVLDDPYELT